MTYWIGGGDDAEQDMTAWLEKRFSGGSEKKNLEFAFASELRRGPGAATLVGD